MHWWTKEVDIFKTEIVVIGLGYVGLPTAVAFSNKFKVIGFDNNLQRIEELQRGFDRNSITSSNSSFNANLLFTNSLQKSNLHRVFIITVPTPVDNQKNPDLSSLMEVSAFVGSLLNKGDLVVYESTTFPGCTEEVCIPLLTAHSDLSLRDDYGVAYSPERISPGDKSSIIDIPRLIAAIDTPWLEYAFLIYKAIYQKNVMRVSNIKVAEAAKLVENCQRDINISFMNEIAIIMDKLSINNQEVLSAAKTKWNFLPFEPGLVGGHCISVDPYYLIHKSKEAGYEPEVIGAGRKVNEFMSTFVASKSVKLMLEKGIDLKKSTALILGATYKENCPDTRNAKVFDIFRELQEYSISVTLFDPVADESTIPEDINFTNDFSNLSYYDIIIIAVPHQVFFDLPISNCLKSVSVVFDLKNRFTSQLPVDASL